MVLSVRHIILTGIVLVTVGRGGEPDRPMSGEQPAPNPAVVVKAELDRSVLPAEQKNTAVLKIELTAAAPDSGKRAPVNLAVVLDKSGSMAGEKLQRAKAAAKDLLTKLDERDVFSFVVYDDDVNALVPAQSAANAKEIARRIDSVEAAGKSALFGGISKAAAELRRNSGQRLVSRMILLSDGRATIGPSAPTDLERLGLSLRKEGISVSTIGLGLNYNEDLLTRLSRAAGGNAYFAKDTKALTAVFKRELADILSVAARDIRVRLATANATSIKRLVGRRGRVRRDRAEVVIPQLYAGLSNYVLVELEVPAGLDAEDRRLATIQTSFDNVLTDRRHTVETAVTVRFSSQKELVQTSINKGVQYDYNLNDNTNFINGSIVLMDQGRRQEAVRNLISRASALRVQANRFGNRPLVGQAAFLEAVARQLAARGLTNPQRKRIVTDNQQIILQQRDFKELYIEPDKLPAGKGELRGKGKHSSLK